MQIRAFIALEFIGKEKLEPVLNELKAYSWLKTVDTSQTHITMRFYEDISDAYSQEVCGYIKGMRYYKFEVNFRGIDCFPGNGICRVFILRSSSETIMQMWNEIQTELGKVKGERKLVPHLTLARTKREPKQEELDQVLSKKVEINLVADRISLIRSVLTPDGPHYSDLCMVQLM